MVPGGHKRPQASEEAPSALYGREDALLIYAAMMEGPTRRTLDSGRILELAELIGRSPGSVSLKVAGYHALEAGDSPRTRRVSWVQRAVRLSFEGNTKGLLEEAGRVRSRILQRLASARLEWAASKTAFLALPDAIEGLAESVRFPRNGCLLYSHSRESVRGVALSSAQILADPKIAAKFATELRKRVGRAARVSPGFSRVEDGAVDSFIQGILSWKFPTLHMKELPRDALHRLGVEAARPLIHRLVVDPRHVETVSKEELAEIRHNIPVVLGLSPSHLCPTCLVLLGFVAGQVQRKGWVHST